MAYPSYSIDHTRNFITSGMLVTRGPIKQLKDAHVYAYTKTTRSLSTELHSQKRRLGDFLGYYIT